MAGFAELMAKRGMTPVSSSSSGPRQKALSQAKAMLSKLSKYTEVGQMNSKTSNQNWWSGSAKNGVRRVTVRYDSKIVPDLVTEVPDNLEGVRTAIEQFRDIIHEVDDDAWLAEEKRRKDAAEVQNDKRRIGTSKGKA
jgi:hypothetical protein